MSKNCHDRILRYYLKGEHVSDYWFCPQRTPRLGFLVLTHKASRATRVCNGTSLNRAACASTNMLGKGRLKLNCGHFYDYLGE